MNLGQILIFPNKLKFSHKPLHLISFYIIIRAFVALKSALVKFSHECTNVKPKWGSRKAF